jgi:Flp pilus assembly protein TadD
MLEHTDDAKNFFTLGLLYANIGQYPIAANYLKKAIDIGDHTVKAKLALSITQNRMGNLATAADLMEEAAQKDANATEIYPVKVVLKQSLFDPILAQEAFRKDLLLDNFYKFSLLFYFAPYKLSFYDNALQTIKKGVKNIDIDKTKSAMDYLVTGKNIAQVNLEIARAIEFSLSHRLYETEAIFQNALKKYPWDAVLHYNLGLTYAQMFNFKDAYHEFAKSQTLDPSLFEAAIFKSYCATLINKDPAIENLDQIYTLLSLSKDKAYRNRIQALLNIAKDTYALPNGYLPVNKHPFDTAIDMIIAYNRAENSAYKKSAGGLKALLPRDLVANILYIDANHSHKKIKAYALTIQKKLLESNLDFKPLYTGETLPRELYIQMLNIAGVVQKLLDQLHKKEPKYGKFIAFKQTKALAEIYTQHFEDAYRTYNTLIDTCKQSDTHTLFLASVAAIGANHPANAIALLELAKLTDTSNMESRYALGLLYQEAKNFDGAVIQYRKIGNSGFKSHYFTFYINK